MRLFFLPAENSAGWITIEEKRRSYMIPDYEAMLEQFYRGFLKSGDVVIDAGAHVGRHTVPILKSVLPSGTIYAFEPLPVCWPSLTGNEFLQTNSQNVTLSKYALGDEDRISDFVVAVDLPAYSGLKERHYDAPTRLEKISVEVRKIDTLFADFNRLDYIKVDAEGGEFGILLGAEKTLARFNPVITFEFGMSSSEAYAIVPEQVFEYLAGLGYSIFDILGHALDRKSFSESSINQAVWDYVALPNEKRELSCLLNAY
jgi:FkbM family methyltransferase